MHASRKTWKRSLLSRPFIKPHMPQIPPPERRRVGVGVISTDIQLVTPSLILPLQGEESPERPPER